MEFLVFNLLAGYGVERRDLTPTRDALVLSAREPFIPFIIQLVFFDKILDNYSLHHYELQRLSEDSGDKSLTLELLSS